MKKGLLWRLFIGLPLALLAGWGSWSYIRTWCEAKPRYVIAPEENQRIRSVFSRGQWLLIHYDGGGGIETSSTEIRDVRTNQLIAVQTAHTFRLISSPPLPPNDKALSVLMCTDMRTQATLEAWRPDRLVPEELRLFRAYYRTPLLSPDNSTVIEEQVLPFFALNLLPGVTFSSTLTSLILDHLDHRNERGPSMGVHLIRIWDTAPFRVRCELSLPLVLGQLTQIALSRDGAYLVVAGQVLSDKLAYFLKPVAQVKDGPEDEVLKGVLGYRIYETSQGKLLHRENMSDYYSHISRLGNGIKTWYQRLPDGAWPVASQLGRYQVPGSKLLNPATNQLFDLPDFFDRPDQHQFLLDGPAPGTLRYMLHLYDPTINSGRLRWCDVKDNGETSECHELWVPALFEVQPIPGSNQIVCKRLHYLGWLTFWRSSCQRFPWLNTFNLGRYLESLAIMDLSDGILVSSEEWINSQNSFRMNYGLGDQGTKAFFATTNGALAVYDVPLPGLSVWQTWLPRVTAVLVAVSLTLLFLKVRRKAHPPLAVVRGA